jgi:hypothetical protein
MRHLEERPRPTATNENSEINDRGCTRQPGGRLYLRQHQTPRACQPRGLQIARLGLDTLR